MKPLALTVTLFVVVCAQVSSGGEVEKMYYVGEAKLSSATGEPLGSQAMLLEKTHDPDHNLIVERAIVVKPDKTTEEHTMTMTVSGNSFTLKDDANTVTGTGTHFGAAWRWTYFHANYQARNGVQIEDENFMTDPSAIVARKKITGPDGKVFTFMDITLKAVTPKTFELLSAALLTK
ncbi:MAG TPA: hypothetical protein VGI81_15730 [Tepidisphaeraceae bacterium]|jgi:hypothetical protein